MFVAVSSPPQAASTIAASTNIVKSMLIFLILSYSFQTYKIGCCLKKNMSLEGSIGCDQHLHAGGGPNLLLSQLKSLL
jgi:hypothetical protein